MTIPSTLESRPLLERFLQAQSFNSPKGCHNGSFFKAQELPSLAFLAQHLSG